MADKLHIRKRNSVGLHLLCRLIPDPVPSRNRTASYPREISQQPRQAIEIDSCMGPCTCPFNNAGALFLTGVLQAVIIVEKVWYEIIENAKFAYEFLTD